ncbi:twin-arginine translocation signal domain-containing protein [Plastorhodobacter daqingensis]|uniref:Twin-arginine translocation signal domain-containing protein n=1 Tax=Plastorhodobacter daqingensis TaxID=1387281 RepID=A0ABW2UL87_9RHOB
MTDDGSTRHPNRRPPEPPAPTLGPDRRGFLKLGLLSAGAAAGAGAAIAQNVHSPAGEPKQRYSLTPHVERFYFLNRL